MKPKTLKATAWAFLRLLVAFPIFIIGAAITIPGCLVLMVADLIGPHP